MLARVQRRAGICFEETNRILKEIADGLIGQLLKMDAETSETLNDLNTLFALCLCAGGITGCIAWIYQNLKAFAAGTGQKTILVNVIQDKWTVWQKWSMEMNVRQKLYEQLALDYCCTPEEVADGKNHFPFTRQERGVADSGKQVNVG